MNRLKELRLKSGKKQTDVAEFLGVTPAAFSYYETGKRELDSASIIKLSEYFSVSADYLLGKNDTRKKCVFAGTFDPFTLGHQKTVEDCLNIFDEVVIAIMVNKFKQPMFSLEERLEIISRIFAGNPNVKIMSWDGIAVDLLKEEGTPFYVRGLRTSVDFDYENTDFHASKKFFPELVEIYLPCRQEYLHISSTMVKNSLLFNKPIDEFVSDKVKDYVLEKFEEKRRD